MLNNLKPFIVIVLCLLLAAPVYAKEPSNRDYDELSDSIMKAHSKCLKKSSKCVAKCLERSPDDRDACLGKCAAKSDACVEPENINKSRYKILNKNVLKRYEQDTDACYEAMVATGRQCERIRNQAKKDRCLDAIQPRLKKCLTQSYKRFKSGERFPELIE